MSPSRLLISFLLVLFSFVWCQEVSAQIIINEVHPAPDEGDEWIELKNITDQVISLVGWQVEDGVGVLTPQPLFSHVEVAPFGLATFEFKNKLNNTGDSVILRKPDFSVVESFSYTSSLSTHSWTRVSTTSSQFVLLPPTKGSENLVPSPSPTPSALPSLSPAISSHPSTGSPRPSPSAAASYSIQLSEVVACPEVSQPEWLELYNPNQFSVQLSEWKVQDSTGNTRHFSVELPGHRYTAIDLSSAILNNDGDELAVLNKEGASLIRISLPGCQRGESSIFIHNDWQQTTIPTKGTANIFQWHEEANLGLSIDSVEGLATTKQSSASSSVPLQYFEFMSSTSQPSASQNSNLSSQSSQPQLPFLPSTLASDSALADLAIQETQTSSLPKSDTTRPPLQRIYFMTLFLLSSVLITLGGYGVYQWYTERRAEAVADLL
ncbi:lamin tail domain-containing protein [Patescibacteria group bacterium]|nr:lamin tail domain-containing protein [Patescibacteria group bacterium]